MFLYDQKTGALAHDQLRLGSGYSGHGPGLNNPDMEDVHSVGPIPRGDWTIGPAYLHPHLGVLVMNLTPVGHDAHGRDLFRMHGDNELMNHTASDGCIILAKKLREIVSLSQDKLLRVT